MNMLTRRIIPCLDVMNGRTVKGVNFLNLRDAGDAVELACKYRDEGADELIFLDITATHEKRKTLAELVKRIAKNINIPFTVGGGITSIEDVKVMLYSGADKITINSAAVRDPDIINGLAEKFGSQCIVVAIDAKKSNGDWKVYLNGGRIPTEIELMDWALDVDARGAGEIMFTSMNHDGTKRGFAIEALKEMSKQVSIPVIASGGAGNTEHFYDAFSLGNADAALAASIFHYRKIAIPELKQYLKERGIMVRL